MNGREDQWKNGWVWFGDFGFLLSLRRGSRSSLPFFLVYFHSTR